MCWIWTRFERKLICYEGFYYSISVPLKLIRNTCPRKLQHQHARVKNHVLPLAPLLPCRDECSATSAQHRVLLYPTGLFDVWDLKEKCNVEVDILNSDFFRVEILKIHFLQYFLFFFQNSYLQLFYSSSSSLTSSVNVKALFLIFSKYQLFIMNIRVLVMKTNRLSSTSRDCWLNGRIDTRKISYDSFSFFKLYLFQ